jgi:hypothetical protein
MGCVMSKSTESKKIYEKKAKKRQRRAATGKQGKYSSKAKQKEYEIIDELKQCSLNNIKRFQVPELTATQRAILNVYLLPGSSYLSNKAVAEIVADRVGHCSGWYVSQFWHNPKCVAALKMIKSEIFDSAVPRIVRKQIDHALEGDNQSAKMILEMSGEYVPPSQRQLTGTNIVLIGDDVAKQGFSAIMDSLSGRKQIEPADAEVIEEEYDETAD